ncbi:MULTISPECIES: TetR/AcrR family transcriptional regulator [Chromobacterium]|uniref:TetR/AcrR family transcriptional regulator n=1 Tax=Chromobacterium aquaticum TaxID=467180 RepID=A0ABV8ZNP2_9NEIS|nr:MULTISPECIES: TetR/AcrR family transcriptional regulator [Chromobacterium]KMN30544.1 TetR family transcriptional regulator [Chromobacterium sp. LK1]MCD5363495.1 TetR/AcrR family transcriptional regulator [Chromobacterium aquaticum]
MAQAPSSRWQRKKDARPSEILDAALALFVEKGFSATKMEDIARAAGVTKGTPYLYFQNKEDIFKAMVLHHLSSRLGAFVELEQQHQGPVGELLQILLLKWWDEVGATPAAGLCKLAIAEATNFPELAQFYTNEVISPCLSMVEHILRRGMDSGEFRPLPIASSCDALLAPLVMAMTWAHSFAKVVPETCGYSHHHSREHLSEALQLVLQGLKNPCYEN